MLTILTGRKGYEFARKHNPVVVQYMTGNDPRDNTEPFYSGPFDGSKPPCVHYAVKRDKVRGYTCAWFHWYHRVDWGGAADFLGGGIDKHPGDFEGCCICVPDDDREPTHIFTRSHNHILHSYGNRFYGVDWFTLESKGHGCDWLMSSDRNFQHGAVNSHVYPNLPLVPLYDESGEYSNVAKMMQHQFATWGTVDWMDQYEDMDLRGKRIEHKGDYWNDPLALVEKMGRQYP